MSSARIESLKDHMPEMIHNNEPYQSNNIAA